MRGGGSRGCGHPRHASGRLGGGGGGGRISATPSLRSPPAGSLKKGERDASPYQCFGKQQEEGANGASQVLRSLPTLPLATRSFSARRRPGVTSRERLTDEDARATVLGKL